MATTIVAGTMTTTMTTGDKTTLATPRCVVVRGQTVIL